MEITLPNIMSDFTVYPDVDLRSKIYKLKIIYE